MGARTESKSPPDTSLDFEAFTESILKADVKNFRKDPGSARLRVMAELAENRHVSLGVGLTIGVLCLGAVDYFLIVGAVMEVGPTRLLLGLAAALVSFAILGMVRKARRDAFVASPIYTWYRMARFAASNGLGFWPEVRSPPFGGTVFRRGVDRVASDVIGLVEPVAIEMGNYAYGGEIEIGRVRQWGFIRIQLDRRLPHMVLEARARKLLTGTRFPVPISSHQALSLEGDFDRYFTLYVPEDYERDALYVFTPDLMALLIDEAAPYDVEIVDDRMYIYSHEPFGMASVETYARLQRIIETVAAKTLRQSARYWDDRGSGRSANTVARQGRRLRLRLDPLYLVGTIVILGGTVAIIVAGALSG